MNIEAMKLALEASEFEQSVFLRTKATVPDYLPKAIASLRQAIAEAEKHEVSQEPVQVTIKDFVKAVEGKEDMVGRPVYWAQWPNADTHPQPKREQDGNCQQCGGKGCVACDARKQEPVAWMFEFPDRRFAPKFDSDSAPHGGNWKPLYTRPQPKQPLTDEQIDGIWLDAQEPCMTFEESTFAFARAIEAAHGIKGEA